MKVLSADKHPITLEIITDEGHIVVVEPKATWLALGYLVLDSADDPHGEDYDTYPNGEEGEPLTIHATRDPVAVCLARHFWVDDYKLGPIALPTVEQAWAERWTYDPDCGLSQERQP